MVHTPMNRKCGKNGIPGILKAAVVACTACLVAPSLASGDIIRGAVTNAAGNAPLDSVKVLLTDNPTIYTFTNTSGAYTLNTSSAAIPGAPNAAGKKTSLFALLRIAPNETSVRVYDTRGAMVWKNETASEARNIQRVFSHLSTGMYAVSVKTGATAACFWVCKPGSGLFFIPERSGAPLAASRTEAATRTDHTLRYTKSGYRPVTKTVSGSQDNINCSMVKSDCGNGKKDPGEVCDGDSKPCNLLFAMKYAKGQGTCNDSCTCYKLDSCVEHPLSDVSSNPNGADHRRAAEITGWAQYTVLQRLQPGMLEGELHTLIDSVYKSYPEYSGLAFSHITGSGPNSTDLHYGGKNRKMLDGDVVVVDIGAKANGWCGDITRTYPVGGKYTPRQREIYQLVLDAQKAAFAELKVKKHSLGSLHDFVVKFFRGSSLRAKDESGNERTMDYFFIHGLSHFIGKTVHGSDLPYNSYSATLKPGWLFSIEPGIYIKSEKFGVRIEDDFMLSDSGPVNIFPNTPVEADHIEALMAMRSLPDLPVHYPTAPDTGVAPRNDHMDF